MVEFTLKFDNWLEFGSSAEKNGDKRTYVGIDRVISLKNPLQNMNSLENTTIKTIAFLIEMIIIKLIKMKKNYQMLR